jgi:N-acetylglucosamine kinase-like BadF-type ATPase
MILIADSGSTKTSWCVVNQAGKTREFDTEGYNPCYSGGEKLIEILKPNLPENFNPVDVRKVAYYGAGVYEDNTHVVQDAIRLIFPNADIDVAMDTVASARALLGRNPGFAAILGTGSNSCLYDGEKIIHYIDSLGFLLGGDEGSGCYMGRRLIGDYIRGYMPEEVRAWFWETYQMKWDVLLERVYSDPMPNRYCASYTRFLTGEHAGHEYLEQQIIRGSFRDFFNNIVKHYPDYQKYSFNSVGTIGWIFRDRLAEVAVEFEMETGNIISNPMEGLVKYHCR